MLTEIGQKAKETSYILGKMGTDLKNAGLLAAAQEILDEEDEILKANAADVAKAKERGMAPGLVDRLELNHKRIEGIVEGMRQVVGLEDPVGEVISMKRRPNGLLIGQKRVPFGVIGVKIGEFLAFQLVYRLLQDLLVRLVTQIRYETALLSPQHIAGPPDIEVLHGDMDTATQLGEVLDRLQPAPCLLRQRGEGRGKEVAEGFPIASSHPSA